ncbi:proprotein convertase subtilisin/kexin type 7 [Protopterus annectens]|uniref:proprotein convertase subtilisin/kexin type 7 n=1 Tax=Protopterus annectens TaxID=7888 RepID=UPI001CFBB754|nr:proprotein convertase subtilisin/kexin type 7 [Protopterus annectens]
MHHFRWKKTLWSPVMRITLYTYWCLFTALVWTQLLTQQICTSASVMQNPGLNSQSKQDQQNCESNKKFGEMTWAVHIHFPSDTVSDDQEDLERLANKLAKAAGLENRGQIGELEGHYLFALACQNLGEDEVERIRRSADEILTKHDNVRWHAEQKLLKRTKRSLHFNDPKYPQQWHLSNDKRPGMDINVTGVWERNVTGKGVTVVVVDDGVEHTIKDIEPNYSPEGSYDLNSNDPDPMPHPDEENDNHHGTRCAGEIAAVPNNNFCAVGVAYESRIAGIRVLDGPLTDSMEAIAFNKHYQINDIYSCSWGPDDDGKTVDGPHALGKAALQHGVIAGRKGFGSIFVVASGNGGQNNDNCNYDGYANSVYTVTIGAVDEIGRMPFYAEECASMLAVTFSSGDKLMRNIVTSDWDLQKGTGCTEGHSGTSAAAPIAAGMIALMLQVRPCLTWRDIQNIIVFTATKYEDRHAVWETNGAGFHHSHQHGFGLLNAWRLVNAAKIWESVPYLASYSSPVIKEEKTIPLSPEQLSPEQLQVVWKVTEADLLLSGMKTLEHVAVTVTITHPRRGYLEIMLYCPSNMSSLIGPTRSIDSDPFGFTDWTFSTVRCWGEKAEGTYRMVITDNSDSSPNLGKLKQWQLTLYGSSWTIEDVKKRQRYVEHAMSGQYLNDAFSLPCPPGLTILEPEAYAMATNTLKTLIILGCFAVFWSVYYMLEVYFTRKKVDLSLLCHNSPCRRTHGGNRLSRSFEARAEMESVPLCKMDDDITEDMENQHEECGGELQEVVYKEVWSPRTTQETPKGNCRDFLNANISSEEKNSEHTSLLSSVATEGT